MFCARASPAGDLRANKKGSLGCRFAWLPDPVRHDTEDQ
jgi:hypothetical protein